MTNPQQAQAANSRIASLYEELRKAIDEGSESMTHDDALKQIAYWRDNEQAQAVEPAECDSPQLCRVSRACTGQYGTKAKCLAPPPTPTLKETLAAYGVKLRTEFEPKPRDHVEVDRNMVGERAELIERQRSVQENGITAEMRELAKATADMLEADADLRTQLARRTVERDMAISMAAGVEAQQVAAPVPMTDEQISAAWESIHPSKEYPVTRLGRRFARAIEKHHGIGAKT